MQLVCYALLCFIIHVVFVSLRIVVIVPDCVEVFVVVHNAGLLVIDSV